MAELGGGGVGGGNSGSSSGTSTAPAERRLRLLLAYLPPWLARELGRRQLRGLGRRLWHLGSAAAAAAARGADRHAPPPGSPRSGAKPRCGGIAEPMAAAGTGGGAGSSFYRPTSFDAVLPPASFDAASFSFAKAMGGTFERDHASPKDAGSGSGAGASAIPLKVFNGEASSGRRLRRTASGRSSAAAARPAPRCGDVAADQVRGVGVAAAE